MTMMKLKLGAIAAITSLLLGCSAAKTAMTKQDLTVESHVSHSVVLEPLAPEDRVVYVRVKDLSGNGMRKPMTNQLKASLSAEGVRVTNNPDEANLMLNAFVIAAKETDKEEMGGFINSSYVGAGEGLATATIVGGLSGVGGKDLGMVAVAGAGLGFLADTLVSDKYYTFVLDVELRERPLEGDSISNSKRTQTSKGYASANSTSQTRSNSSVNRGQNYNWITYETRIVSVANQMNLTVENAKPLVIEKTASTLSEFLL